MSDHADAAAPDEDVAERTVAAWRVDAAVAGLLLLVGGVVMADSARVGAGWAPDGPEAGFFPFYIGLVLAASSAYTLARSVAPSARATRRAARSFVDRSALGRVLGMLAPAVVFVATAKWLGIYLASAALVAFFMRLHGGFRLLPALALGAAIAAVLFAVFEVWLLMPLPKGPVEDALGF